MGRWQPEGLTEEVLPQYGFAEMRIKSSISLHLTRPRLRSATLPKVEGLAMQYQL